MFCGTALALEINYPSFGGADLSDGSSLSDLAKYAFNVLVGIIGLVVLFVFLKGGFDYMTSTDNAAKKDDAKKRIIAGITGAAIILSSYTIIYIINPDLLNLEMPDVVYVEIPEPPESSETTEKYVLFKEIPLASLITSETTLKSTSYSSYEGVISDLRIKKIEKVTETAKSVSMKLRLITQEYKSLADWCDCSRCDNGSCDIGKCTTTDPSKQNCVSNCDCTGEFYSSNDPCPQREEMDKRMNQISVLSGAFEAFLKKDTTVSDYIVSNDALIASLDPDLKNEIWAYITDPDTGTGMKEIEGEYGSVEQVKEDLRSAVLRLEEAEDIMKSKSSYISSYKDFSIMSQSYAEEEIEVKKEKLFDFITTESDPASFYSLEEQSL